MTVLYFTSNLGTEMEYTLSNALFMVVAKKEHTENSEKEWDNPIEPSKSSDERDKEQLLRQYKEAKRRKDNLTETEDTNNETKNT